MRKTLSLVLAVVLLGFVVLPVSAHTFAPALLEIQQGADEKVNIRWKQPAIKAVGSQLLPRLPETCQAQGAPAVHEEGTGIIMTWEAECSVSLVGETIRVDGIAGSRADVLLRLELDDGRSLRHVLTADAPSYLVPETESLADVMVGYAGLGVEHILGGFDHLLFVLGLVLLVTGGRRLLVTVTAFTLGHSVTLALAVLGFVHMPSGPTEAAIALSIYVLALELVRRKTSQESLMQRSPWLVAGLFGLLHGLGFAGALSEIGLPAHEIPAALFAFNVGIEVGQLAFVAVVLAVGWMLTRCPERWTEQAWTQSLAQVPTYVIGSLSAFWFLERVLGLF